LKTLKRIFKYFILTGVAIFIASLIAIFLYKDQIIRQLVRELNKSLLTKIDVEYIDLDLWESFPKINLVLNHVLVFESNKATKVLGKFESIHLGFSLTDLIHQNFEFNNLRLVNGNVDLIIDTNGDTNYQIIKPGKGEERTTFVLNRFSLDSIEIRYRDFTKSTDLKLLSQRITGALRFDEVYQIQLQGSLYSDYILLSETKYLQNKLLQLNGALIYSISPKLVEFQNLGLLIEQSEFDISGIYNLDLSTVDLAISSRNSTLNNLKNLIKNESVSKKIESYQGKGIVEFTSILKGPVSRNKMPLFKGELTLKNGSISYPEVQSEISGISIEGFFEIPDLKSTTKASLILTTIDAQFEGKTISGDLRIKNFSSPLVVLNFNGSINLRSLLTFYPMVKIENASGKVDFDLSYENSIEKENDFHLTGEVDLENVEINYSDRLPLSELNGNLLFNNKDIALNHFTGKFGNSDFRLNGFFKNIIGYLNQDNSIIGIEADLKSDFIDIDELLLSNNQSLQGDYSFSISPNLFLAINCDLKSLRFRRFTASNLTGQLNLKDRIALAKDISAETLGGSINLSGLVNATKSKLEVTSYTKLKSIHIDSLFYVFENFNQDWLVDSNLKGQINAEWEAEMLFDEYLNLFSEDLITDISITIMNGELNNFEPIMGLSKYVEDEDLSDLRFSQIVNDIHIEDEVIILPEMKVSSNITEITFSGTHTFKQQIDYRVAVPFRLKKRKNRDEFFGAIEEDKSGQTLLFLKIQGSTENYDIFYDTESVKRKIVADLKKEVEELKQAFRKRGEKKQESLGLNEDEYFDWDDEKQ